MTGLGPRAFVSQDQRIKIRVVERKTGKFRSNQAALKAWLAVRPMTLGLKPQTKKRYDLQVAKYLNTLDWSKVHYAKVTPDTFTDYMEARTAQCRFFRQATGAVLAAGCTHPNEYKIKANMSNCGDGLCPSWEPTSRTRQENHHQAIQKFHEWLVLRGALKYNWLTEWRNRWYQQNPKRSMRRPNILTPEEVVMLVEGTEHPVRRAAYVLMYRCGLRWHEVRKLRIDAPFWNPRENHGEIPSDGEVEGKRKGSHFFVLDAETQYWLEGYLRYRTRIAHPSCNRLLIGNHGGELEMDAARVNARWLAPDCKRLGLRQAPGQPQIKTHSFRRGFSDVLRQQAQDMDATAKADDIWHLLRGDLVDKLVQSYTETHRDQLIEYYRKYAPSIFVARTKLEILGKRKSSAAEA